MSYKGQFIELVPLMLQAYEEGLNPSQIAELYNTQKTIKLPTKEEWSHYGFRNTEWAGLAKIVSRVQYLSPQNVCYVLRAEGVRLDTKEQEDAKRKVRDEKIYIMAVYGNESYKALGKKWGLTGFRIGCIVMAQTHKQRLKMRRFFHESKTEGRVTGFAEDVYAEETSLTPSDLCQNGL